MAGLLAGRRALVTGASRGIGAEIAAALAAEGADVALNGRHESDELAAAVQRCAEYGVRAVTAVGDVAEVDGSRQAVESAREQLGGLDILVNNAGTLTQSPLVDMDVEMWDSMLATDLRSVFLCTKWALPGMVEQGWGRIISIGSQLGVKGAPEMAHYAAAKAGLLGFTRSVAREVASKGVLANVVAPGPIETDMTDDLPDEWREQKKDELPLGRFGRVEEVAPSVVLLTSDPGGNLFVGQALHPNSGDVMP